MTKDEAKEIIRDTNDVETAARKFANADCADVESDGEVWISTTGWMKEDRLVQFAK